LSAEAVKIAMCGVGKEYVNMC